MSLQPIFIAGSAAGLEADKKPFLFVDQAFQSLQNAYAWRDQVKKREGKMLLGRLQRSITSASGGNITFVNPSPNSFDLFSLLGLLATEPNAEVVPGNIVPISITIGGQVLSDSAGTGILSVTAGNITGAFLDYATGILTLNFSAPAGPLAVTITMGYYPSLPVMGIIQREETTDSVDQTIFFDQKYAYINTTGEAGGFQEFITGTTWDGGDGDFFSGCNYTSSAGTKILFVSNYKVNPLSAGSPIRFTNGVTWTAFSPQLDTVTNFLFQAQVLIPYYGRLVALNTWEGTTIGTAVNYFNRCRFSQIGDPTAADAWRVDTFGKGGFIDAPTNEALISAKFFRNTLIVEFEYSTWQLRYVGQYGLPFIWERISSDFGSGSPYAGVVFDQGVRTVGNRAIIEATSNGVKRIDEQIPDQVFAINYVNSGLERVQGIRDYQKEIVYWNYNDSSISTSGVNDKFPNRILVNNYRNATYAIFRDNVTVFGTYQQPTAGVVTWSSDNVFFDDDEVFWEDLTSQTQFPSIVSGNQQGWVHYFNKQTFDDPSLSITAVTLSATSPSISLQVNNHNLEDFDIVYLQGMLFIDSGSLTPLATNLNGNLYAVRVTDRNNITLIKWDSAAQNYESAFAFTPVTTATYVGGGELTLIPRLYVQTKDFNPYQKQSRQMMMSYIDFLTEVPEEENDPDTSAPTVEMSVQIFGNTSLAYQGNLTVGNNSVETSLIQPFYPAGMDYGWHRFYATFAAQYITVVLTYDDNLMNNLTTHQNDWRLHALAIWARAAGKLNI